VIFSSVEEEAGVELVVLDWDVVGVEELALEDLAVSDEDELPPWAQLTMRKEEAKTKRPVNLKCFLSIMTSKHLHVNYRTPPWLKMISETRQRRVFSFSKPNHKN
jgi:hypothetical protein